MADHTDAELRTLAEQVVNKQSDFDKISCDVMDTSTEPPPNSGDGSVANEIQNFGMDTPSHSKVNTNIPKRRRKVFEPSRSLLLRKSKTKAYEALKRIAKGVVVPSAPIVRRGQKRRRPKRLNQRQQQARRRKNVGNMKGRGRNPTACTYSYKRSRPCGRRPPRSRPMNQDSGTSISTMLSTATTASTSRADEFSQHDLEY